MIDWCTLICRWLPNVRSSIYLSYQDLWFSVIYCDNSYIRLWSTVSVCWVKSGAAGNKTIISDIERFTSGESPKVHLPQFFSKVAKYLSRHPIVSCSSGAPSLTGFVVACPIKRWLGVNSSANSGYRDVVSCLCHIWCWVLPEVNYLRSPQCISV